MVFKKLTNLFETNNNIIKIIIILIGLYILFRIFTDNTNTKNNIEGFTVNVPDIFGNTISLSDKTNIPTFTGANQCTFSLDGIYRIDTIKLNFNTVKNNILIQFLDGNGNMKYIKANNSQVSPPTYNTDNSKLLMLKNITDENGLTVYTNKITIITQDTIPTGTTTPLVKIINKYEIFGGNRTLPSITDFQNYLGNASNNTLIPGKVNNDNDNRQNIDTYTFSTGDNQIMYLLKLSNLFSQISTQTTTTSAQPISTQTTTTSAPKTNSISPFVLTIKYYNSIYPDNEFTIKTNYIIRNDSMSYNTTNSTNLTYIFLDEPIIANKISISVPRTNITNTSNLNQLNISSVNFYGNTPNSTDINLYKRNVNLTMQDQGNTGDVCPGLNDIADKQSKTQQICDNLEYQDKVKAEKLRLERNKQYLLKLKQQQEQIDELNTVITDLETKRQSRAQIADQSRLSNYQTQKDTASRVRDIANQRLQLQDTNSLYFDVKVNSS